MQWGTATGVDLTVNRQRAPSFWAATLLAFVGIVLGTLIIFVGRDFGQLTNALMGPKESMFTGVENAATPSPTITPSVGPLTLRTGPPASGQLPAIRELFNPRFYIWAFLTAAEVGLWVVVGVPLWQHILLTPPGSYPRGTTVVAAVSLFALLAVPAALSTVFWPAEEFLIRDPATSWRDGALSLLAFVTALPALLTIWRTYRAADAFAPPAGDPQQLPDADDLNVYLRIRRDLQDSVSVLGILTATAILADSALRNSLNAPIVAFVSTTKVGADDLRQIPPDAVLAYGLYLTMLLGLVYVPTYLRLVDVGWRLQRAAAPLLSPGDPNWTTSLQKRKSLIDLMTLETGPADNLKASIAILSPFITSIAGSLLTTK